MHRTSLLEKENGVFDPATWEPAKKQAEAQLNRLSGWIEKSPSQALVAAVATGLVLGWILKRR